MTYDELVAKKYELQGQADEINKQIAMIDNKLTYAKHAKAEKILDEIIKKVSELNDLGWTLMAKVDSDCDLGWYEWGETWVDLELKKLN